MSLSRHGLRQKGFSRSGRAHKEGALGQFRADFRIFRRVVEEIHNLRQRLLRLVLSRHVLKGDAGLLLHVNLGVGFAYAHDPASAEPAHHGSHQKYQESEPQQGAYDVNHQAAGLLQFPNLNPVILQPHGQLVIALHPHSIVPFQRRVAVHVRLRVNLNLRVAHRHGFDLPSIHHLDKLVVGKFFLRAAGESIFHEINSGKGDQSRNQ